DEMLRQRRVVAAGADVHGDVEPLPALHGVGSDDPRRVLGVVGAAQLLELRRELLFLARLRATARSCGEPERNCQTDDDRIASSAFGWASHRVFSLVSPVIDRPRTFG